MQSLTFMIFIVPEKIATFKFFPHTDTRPSGLPPMITYQKQCNNISLEKVNNNYLGVTLDDAGSKGDSEEYGRESKTGMFDAAVFCTVGDVDLVAKVCLV